MPTLHLSFYSNGFFEFRILWLKNVIINPTFIKVFSDEKQVFYRILVFLSCPNSEAVSMSRKREETKQREKEYVKLKHVNQKDIALIGS